jgi:hypothetical protein
MGADADTVKKTSDPTPSRRRANEFDPKPEVFVGAPAGGLSLAGGVSVS